MGHLIGDYILQNEWMAKNKKISSFHCLVHCTIWTTCVVLAAAWPIWTTIPLFITHFIQDRTKFIYYWMEFMGQKDFRDGPCSPWSMIVVDNVLHLFTIWIISKTL